MSREGTRRVAVNKVGAEHRASLADRDRFHVVVQLAAQALPAALRVNASGEPRVLQVVAKRQPQLCRGDDLPVRIPA